MKNILIVVLLSASSLVSTSVLAKTMSYAPIKSSDATEICAAISKGGFDQGKNIADKKDEDRHLRG